MSWCWLGIHKWFNPGEELKKVMKLGDYVHLKIFFQDINFEENFDLYYCKCCPKTQLLRRLK